MRRIAVLAAGALAIATACSGASATTYTWNGSVNMFWSNAANWTPSGVPQSGDAIVLPANPGGSMTNDLATGTSLAISGDCACVIYGNEIVSTSIQARYLQMIAPLRLNGIGDYYFLRSLGPIDAGPYQLTLSVKEVRGPLSGNGLVYAGGYPLEFGSDGPRIFFFNTQPFRGELRSPPMAVFGEMRDAIIVTRELTGGGVVGPVIYSDRGTTFNPRGRLEALGAGLIGGVFPSWGSQLVVHGGVSLWERAGFSIGGLVTDPAPAVGDSFTLIDNDGTDPIQGTFIGIPEGGSASMFQSIGRRYHVTYAGGDGNDVVVTVISHPEGTPLDLDGNGRSDVVFRNEATGAVYRLPLSGATPGAGAEIYREPNLDWSIAGHGDFDGDGHGDLLWRNAATGDVYVQFMRDGRPDGGSVVHREPNPSWRIAAVTNVDADGKSDIVWHHAVTGEVYVMLMDGAAIKAQGTAYREPDTQWRIVGAPASYFRGRLLWRNAASGATFLQDISYKPATSSFQTEGSVLHVEPDMNWKIACTADLGDSANNVAYGDIVWQNAATGQAWAMRLNVTTSSIASQGPIHTPESSDWKVVACGDYNGDNIGDLLWRNASDGRVYVMLMSASGPMGGGVAHVEADARWRIVGPAVN